jgi:hypothetical protein
MKINSEKLFLRDLFYYDIGSCHYNILKGLGIDLSGIDPKNKTERNIKIGMLMRDNPNLTSMLRTVTEATINEYLTRNNIEESSVIIRQYDGVITTKPMAETDSFLPLELRGIIQTFLSSFNRDKFLALYQNSEISIKGVPQRYEIIDEIFAKILKINFLSKWAVFESLQKIREEVFTSKNSLLYYVPEDKSEGSVILKGYGPTRISKTMARVMDASDVDREWYWKFYFQDFSKSIVKEFV